MDRTIALISLGCAKNLVNSEQMLYLLSEAGYALAPSPDGADAVIINTCGFIDAAKSEAQSRGQTRQDHSDRLPYRTLPRRSYR